MMPFLKLIVRSLRRKKNTVLLPLLLRLNIVSPDLANAIPAVHQLSASDSASLNGIINNGEQK